MPAAALPPNEQDRLSALRSYDVLDTACEASYDRIAELAAQLTGAPIALVSLVDADRIYHKAWFGIEIGDAPREHSFCAHAILRPDDVTVVPDARLDDRFADNPFVLDAPDIRFYAGAPLVSADGMPLGMLCVLDRAPREMSPTQRQGLVRLAETAMTTLELRRAMVAARRMAMMDTLTGLPNRTALQEAVERAISRLRRHRAGFALLYIDLDGFKGINDRLGHAMGDTVLREVASLMAAHMRREDLGARIGGDEFAVIMLDDGLDAEAAAERLRLEIGRGMAAHGWPVTASVGAVMFRTPPASVAEALQRADQAMYVAKGRGKDQIAYVLLEDAPEVAPPVVLQHTARPRRPVIPDDWIVRVPAQPSAANGQD